MSEDRRLNQHEYFVYYFDYFCDNAGYGIEGFPDRSAAIDFINRRIAVHPDGRAKVEDYLLICGRVLPLEAYEKVIAVRIKSGT